MPWFCSPLWPRSLCRRRLPVSSSQDTLRSITSVRASRNPLGRSGSHSRPQAQTESVWTAAGCWLGEEAAAGGWLAVEAVEGPLFVGGGGSGKLWRTCGLNCRRFSGVSGAPLENLSAAALDGWLSDLKKSCLAAYKHKIKSKLIFNKKNMYVGIY